MKRYILLLSAILLFAACTVRRPAATPQAPAATQTTQSSRPATLKPVRESSAPGELLPERALPEPAAVVEFATYSLLVDENGKSSSVTGSYKGSDPREKALFGSSETAHVKISAMPPKSGQMLIVPLPAYKAAFYYPQDGKVISNFGMRSGRMHTGVDIKARPGDTLRAAWDGVVRMSKPYAAYGNLVTIRHSNGLETVYGHNTRNLVRENDFVRAGQPIALAGRTGRATTEHLHFEVRVAGCAMDPSLFVDHNNRSLQNDTLFLYNQGGTILAIRSSRPDFSKLPKTLAQTSTDYLRQGNRQNPYLPPVVDMAYSAPAAGPSPVPSTVSVPSSVPAQETPHVQHPKPVAPASPAPAPTYHTVAKGDTLSAISRRYGVSVKQICELNNITNPDALRLGQKIKLPAKK